MTNSFRNFLSQLVEDASSNIDTPKDNISTETSTAKRWDVEDRDDTINSIADRESFSPKAFWDVNGYAVGYGNHYVNGKKVTADTTITREEAYEELGRQVDSRKKKILKFFGSKGIDRVDTDHLGGLISLDYNVGDVTKYTRTMNTYIDGTTTGNFIPFQQIFSTIKSNDKHLEGLLNRRTDELLSMFPEKRDDIKTIYNTVLNKQFGSY